MFPRSARSAPGRHGQAGWPFELWETPRLGAFWESGPLGQDRHGFYLFSADGGVSPSPTHLGGVTDVLRNSQGSQSAGSSAGPAEAPTGHCVASGAGEPRWDQQAPSCAEPCWALEPLFVATEPVPGERSGAADLGSQVAASLREPARPPRLCGCGSLLGGGGARHSGESPLGTAPPGRAPEVAPVQGRCPQVPGAPDLSPDGDGTAVSCWFGVGVLAGPCLGSSVCL